jgi:hypothetical protein
MVNRHVGGLSCILLTMAACKEQPRLYSTRASAGKVVFRDAFERGELGPDWAPSGPGAWVEDGVLKVRELQNHPVWLDQPLPDDVRIEFDVRATSEEGDIKFEVAGDGTSFATQANYVASGYVVIFGGWNNTMSAIVRRNEHGQDRATTTEPKVGALADASGIGVSSPRGRRQIVHPAEARRE